MMVSVKQIRIKVKNSLMIGSFVFTVGKNERGRRVLTWRVSRVMKKSRGRGPGGLASCWMGC